MRDILLQCAGVECHLDQTGRTRQQGIDMVKSIAWLLGWLLGLGLAANGLVMMGIPDAWYANVPGAVDTGPFNAHFVRDVGAIYVTCGAAFLWFAASPPARPAAQIAAAFLAIHGLIHLWDAVAGREAATQLLSDAPAVFLPPVLAIWIVLALPERRDRTFPE